jgi:hypothetical protein
MVMRIGGFIALLFVPAGLAGCLPAGETPSASVLEREILAPADRIVAAAVAVLEEIGIPVGPVDGSANVVQSEWFTVQGTWGGVPAEERVDCGVDAAGAHRARTGPVGLNVNLSIRAIPASPHGAAVMDRPDPAGYRVRVASKGSSPPSAPGLGADAGAPAPAGSSRCTLAAPFSAQILNAVAARAMEDQLR